MPDQLQPRGSRLVVFAMMAAVALAGFAIVYMILQASDQPAISRANAQGLEVVEIGGRAFELELAADATSRERGFMNRESISESGGMLFVFPDSQITVQRFWMGNCLVDMDIMFLDPQGRITAMHRMKAEAPRGPDESMFEYDARMRRYSSIYPAQFAIELRAGWLDQLNLHERDRIALDLPRLKAMAR